MRSSIRRTFFRFLHLTRTRNRLKSAFDVEVWRGGAAERTIPGRSAREPVIFTLTPECRRPDSRGGGEMMLEFFCLCSELGGDCGERGPEAIGALRVGVGVRLEFRLQAVGTA